MPVPLQPQLFPDPPSAAPPQPIVEGLSGFALWMQRVSLVILVFFCVDVGVFMTYLPWWTAVWDHNLLFSAHPALGHVMRLGAVRGLITGVGVVDIWIGVTEAVHYRER